MQIFRKLGRKIGIVRAVNSLCTLTVVVGAAVIAAAPLAVTAQQPPSSSKPPSFTAGVDVVSVAAVVRDRRGRFVRDLTRGDFEVLDGGRRRPIIEFRVESTASVSLALLFDVSGSMHHTFADARHAADHLLSWIEPGRDEAALFTFDTSLKELIPFASDRLALHEALDSVKPFGATSLYDAIAASSRQVMARASRRRALVVLTDGVDTSSRLEPAQVSAIASGIDVPIYVIVVAAGVDHTGSDTALASRTDVVAGELADLARWTGGDVFVTSAPAHTSIAARRIVDELRHQYLIAFESSGSPGWHRVEVRTKDPDLSVRARSGYIAGQGRS